jgi:hypothetical protein
MMARFIGGAYDRKTGGENRVSHTAQGFHFPPDGYSSMVILLKHPLVDYRIQMPAVGTA